MCFWLVSRRSADTTTTNKGFYLRKNRVGRVVGRWYRWRVWVCDLSVHWTSRVFHSDGLKSDKYIENRFRRLESQRYFNGLLLFWYVWTPETSLYILRMPGGRWLNREIGKGREFPSVHSRPGILHKFTTTSRQTYRKSILAIRIGAIIQQSIIVLRCAGTRSITVPFAKTGRQMIRSWHG